ncbi:hypothetical protein G7046_g7151 [Stylonectria norvegica]|nr:hypothetical protein G7046_g7151 [Stylonectria norvegica]
MCKPGLQVQGYASQASEPALSRRALDGPSTGRACLRAQQFHDADLGKNRVVNPAESGELRIWSLEHDAYRLRTSPDARCRLPNPPPSPPPSHVPGPASLRDSHLPRALESASGAPFANTGEAELDEAYSGRAGESEARV